MSPRDYLKRYVGRGGERRREKGGGERRGEEGRGGEDKGGEDKGGEEKRTLSHISREDKMRAEIEQLRKLLENVSAVVYIYTSRGRRGKEKRRGEEREGEEEGEQTRTHCTLAVPLMFSFFFMFSSFHLQFLFFVYCRREQIKKRTNTWERYEGSMLPFKTRSLLFTTTQLN